MTEPLLLSAHTILLQLSKATWRLFRNQKEWKTFFEANGDRAWDQRILARRCERSAKKKLGVLKISDGMWSRSAFMRHTDGSAVQGTDVQRAKSHAARRWKLKLNHLALDWKVRWMIHAYAELRIAPHVMAFIPPDFHFSSSATFQVTVENTTRVWEEMSTSMCSHAFVRSPLMGHVENYF